MPSLTLKHTREGYSFIIDIKSQLSQSCPITLMGTPDGVRADHPDGPCDWMYRDGRKIRQPFGKDVNYSSIAQIMDKIRTTSKKSSPRKSFEELKGRGDFKYFGGMCFRFCCLVSSSHPSMPLFFQVSLHLHPHAEARGPRNV